MLINLIIFKKIIFNVLFHFQAADNLLRLLEVNQFNPVKESISKVQSTLVRHTLIDVLIRSIIFCYYSSSDGIRLKRHDLWNLTCRGDLLKKQTTTIYRPTIKFLKNCHLSFVMITQCQSSCNFCLWPGFFTYGRFYYLRIFEHFDVITM